LFQEDQFAIDIPLGFMLEDFVINVAVPWKQTLMTSMDIETIVD